MKIINVSSVHPWQDNRVYFKVFASQDKYFASEYFTADKKAPNCLGIRSHRLVNNNNILLRVLLNSPYLLLRAFMAKPAIIHIHDPELLIWVKIFRIWFKDVIVVFDMHELIHEQILRVLRIKSSGLNRRNYIYKFIIFSCQKLCLSENVVFAEQDYSNFYKARKSIEVYNFPRLELYERDGLCTDSLESGELVLGYIGAMSPERGFFQMLRLCESLIEGGWSIRLDLVGQIPDYLKECSLFKTFESNGTISALGFLSHDRAIDQMREWDIGLCILEGIPNYIDSIPTKIFEYGALGIPVLTSNFPCYCDIVNKYSLGAFVNPMDDDDIFQTIKEMIPRLDDLKRRIKRDLLLSECSWESQEMKLIEFYHGL